MPRKGSIGPPSLGQTARMMVESLGREDPASHSYHSSFADTTITQAGPKIAALHVLNGFGNMADKNEALKKAGWDGKTCIGFEGNGHQCGRIIPLARRRAIKHCYRCAECQDGHEKFEQKTNHRRGR